ncbi:MAG: hypothetical protein AVDCRST_MAG96-1230 [uncultured Segetibacter sp.]|uniref:Uncharacterized protein n=1 Tax=uncultured Segetibacter sp. TaxID=481133 RepID=A0A6J4S8D3_9BACT|nr:MAG: hypothetical protein AVDCRST_MAG96-1230 [uncultured Segetibacter sp.]
MFFSYPLWPKLFRNNVYLEILHILEGSFLFTARFTIFVAPIKYHSVVNVTLCLFG